MSPMTDGENARKTRDGAHARLNPRPDRRRAPEGPPPDPRATERAIERLWAVIGR